MKPSEALKFLRPLRDHQKQALDRFAFHSEAALFWEMGTGKTTEAISWLRCKYNIAREVTPTLIVSPVATLYNWLDEFKINAPAAVVAQVLVPYMRTRRVKYTGKERAEVIRGTAARIVIVNPEALDNDDVAGALLHHAPRNVIVDEAHKFKSHEMHTGNARSRKPSRLSKLATIADRADNRMIMTGTPILNSYLDLWAQFRILDGGRTFGTNFYSFRERYFEDKNLRWRGQPKYFPKWEPKSDAHTELSRLLDDKASRLKKTDCLDLPPLEYETYYVEMGDDQAKAYFQMEKDLLAEVQGGVCAAVNALSKVNRLLQILSGHLPVEHDLANEKVLTHFRQNPRLDALAEILTQLIGGGHKVIVWCSFKASYTQVRQLLRENAWQYAEITGDTKDRQAEKERFQNDPDCKVMLSNPQAGGVGINLTAASYAVYYSRSYSLGDRLQSEARNHRGGSEIHDKITLIDLVVKDTLDEEVLSALLRKENFADNVLDRLQAKG